jgi:hypothetical protein
MIIATGVAFFLVNTFIAHTPRPSLSTWVLIFGLSIPIGIVLILLSFIDGLKYNDLKMLEMIS